MLFPQLLCFENDPFWLGRCTYPPLAFPSRPGPARPPIPSPIPLLFTFLRTLLHIIAPPQNSTPFLSSDSALFAKNAGGGGSRGVTWWQDSDWGSPGRIHRGSAA